MGAGVKGRIALSVGCPCGIGPEVSVAGAVRSKSKVLLVGDYGNLCQAAEAIGERPARLSRVQRPEDAWDQKRGQVGVWEPLPPLKLADRRFGKPTAASGAAQIQWVDAACDLVSRGVATALTTGPVSKYAVVRSGLPRATQFRGHTEYLQRRLRARQVIMAFWADPFSTSLVTTHLPISRVPRAITPERVASSVFWLGMLLAQLKGEGDGASRVAVAGLNPHAGEDGVLGDEEVDRIVPGMKKARERFASLGVEVALTGPVPAESAFRLASQGKFDGVVAMYHDQATIPMKLVGFGEAVNVSLGLPIIRTSVDHGTAYDIAGTGKADPRGMTEAIRLANRLSTVRPYGR